MPRIGKFESDLMTPCGSEVSNFVPNANLSSIIACSLGVDVKPNSRIACSNWASMHECPLSNEG